jgi:hypothetical protein
MTAFRFPNFDEMRALERAARRARERELARFAQSATAYISRRVASLFAAKRMRHA